MKHKTYICLSFARLRANCRHFLSKIWKNLGFGKSAMIVRRSLDDQLCGISNTNYVIFEVCSKWKPSNFHFCPFFFSKCVRSPYFTLDDKLKRFLLNNEKNSFVLLKPAKLIVRRSWRIIFSNPKKWHFRIDLKEFRRFQSF